jgi:hypothetical protein
MFTFNTAQKACLHQSSSLSLPPNSQLIKACFHQNLTSSLLVEEACFFLKAEFGLGVSPSLEIVDFLTFKNRLQNVGETGHFKPSFTAKVKNRSKNLNFSDDIVFSSEH